jgi:hypothetical protein
VSSTEQRLEARATIPLARGSAAVPVVTAALPDLEPAGNGRENGAARDGAARDGAARDGAARDGAARDGAARDGAARDGERAREPTSGPVPLPRRRLAEPHQWPAIPADQVRAPVEECSDSTLMRIHRALRALR